MGLTLWQSLSNCADAMAQNALKDVNTLEEWERVRPQRHTEFMRSMGLDPLPEKCDLKLTDYGEFAGEGYRARRVAFQILSDCWTTACIYYPDPAPKAPAPGVLYVCGHNTLGTYGFQSHGVMWARRGYVCLIVDTIEQNDNPGEHHGYEKGLLDAWMSMGYTVAGGEMWNAIRALDVLAADPLVDADRLGTTGVSGGGADSFYLAVADERIKAVSTLCGVSTPKDAITNRHLIYHCNCMYYNNVYRRDTSEYGAVIAPRALLYCFAHDDQIFRLDEVKDLAERTRRAYRLYGQEEKCDLATCPGPHGDHPEFDEATSRWFDRHLAGEERPLVEREDRDKAETVISVFHGRPPSPNLLDMLPRLITPLGTVPLPKKPQEWPEIRRQALESLPPFPGDDGDTGIEFRAKWMRGEGALSLHEGRIDGMDVCMYVNTKVARPSKLMLGVGSPGDGAPDIMGILGGFSDDKTTAFAGLEGRTGGLSGLPLTAKSSEQAAWSVNKRLPFAMALTGVTPVTIAMHDIAVVLEYLRGRDEFKDTEIYLYGKGDAGVAALYRGVLDERIAGVVVENGPSSHMDGSPILGVLRAFDMPQAVGLMAPRKVALVHPGHSFWTWPERAYERLGCPENFLMAHELRPAVEMILA